VHGEGSLTTRDDNKPDLAKALRGSTTAVHVSLAGPPTSAQTLNRLCEILGHDFHDVELLRRAVTHRSYTNESADVATDNQRLEFLGDSVIGLVIAGRLFRAIPNAAEGLLTVLKARCVSEPALAEVARRIRLGEVLRLGRGERRRGGAALNSVLADALEAVIGAVFIDGGYLAASKVVSRIFKPELDATVHAGRAGERLEMRISGGRGTTGNWKTPLQELLQEHGRAHPDYTVVESEGPPHRRTFTVEVEATLGDKVVTARGEGSSKKAASHEAAKALYARLRNHWTGNQ